jgi:predicted ATPase/class 3 adenylate cyclase
LPSIATSVGAGLDSTLTGSHDLVAVRSDLPSGTVTFLFTDVEGSTKLLHEVGRDQYAKMLAEHRALVREACSAHGGVEVDTQGDAFFVAFPTGPGALKAAQAITEGLASGPITLRIGLHTGTPLVTDEGYVGEDVHRASRIAAAGHGGQVLVAASTAALLDADLVDLGEHRFKDLAASERVYQLGKGAFPPLKSLHRTNLPVPVTPFLGRERELGEVVDLLAREDVRLLTLSGPGGTGKTRLAVQAASLAADGYPDGVWWVPLAPVRDPFLLLSAVAQAVDVREVPGTPLADTLVADLKGKRTLILLDNAEHLLPDAAGEIAKVRAAEGPVLLVTSRERLQLRGETIFPVQTLEEMDAVALFLAHARALEPAFQVDRAVAELCSRLDNLPLAIELAAARTIVFSPAQLLERLAERLDLLKAGRDADPRQQTLRATLEWSYELLDSEEQRVFRSLAVFTGGSTYEALEEVCGADLDTLQSLLDKSLVRRRASELVPRYWMLETIREYALERLSESGDLAAEAVRHARYYERLVEGLADSLVGETAISAMERLDEDAQNLHAAVIWLREHDERSFVSTASRLQRFWWTRGYLAEGRAFLADAANRRTADPGWVNVATSLAFHLLNEPDTLDEAAKWAREALEVAQKLGDDSLLAQVLMVRGNVAAAFEDYESARASYAESAVLAAGVGDRRAVANAKANEASLALSADDFASAATLGEQSLTAYSAIQDQEGIGFSHVVIGAAALFSGDPDRAIEESARAVRALIDLGHQQFLAIALYTIALALDRSSNRSVAAEITILTEAALGGPQFEDFFEGEERMTLERLRLEERRTTKPSREGSLRDVAVFALDAIGAGTPTGTA